MLDLKGADEISEAKAVKQLQQTILEDGDHSGTIPLITAMERWFSIGRYIRKSVNLGTDGDETCYFHLKINIIILT